MEAGYQQLFQPEAVKAIEEAKDSMTEKYGERGMVQRMMDFGDEMIDVAPGERPMLVLASSLVLWSMLKREGMLE